MIPAGVKIFVGLVPINLRWSFDRPASRSAWVTGASAVFAPIATSFRVISVGVGKPQASMRSERARSPRMSFIAQFVSRNWTGNRARTRRFSPRSAATRTGPSRFRVR